MIKMLSMAIIPIKVVLVGPAFLCLYYNNDKSECEMMLMMLVQRIMNMMNFKFKVVLTKQLIGCLPCANQTLALHLNEEFDHLDGDDDDGDGDDDYNVCVDGVDGFDDHDHGSLCLPCANQTLAFHLNEEVDHLDDDDDDDSDGDYNVGVDGVDGVDDHDPGSLCIPCTD